MKTLTDNELLNAGLFRFVNEDDNFECIAVLRDFCEGNYISFVKDISKNEELDLPIIYSSQIPKSIKY